TAALRKLPSTTTVSGPLSPLLQTGRKQPTCCRGRQGPDAGQVPFTTRLRANLAPVLKRASLDVEDSMTASAHSLGIETNSLHLKGQKEQLARLASATVGS